ncbi:helix-turn-helix transcriptional regulator [Schumannella soli]|uniref:Helix-turn-helix transcriptional regulator n=1 Tax=Schumannella soli TaxID=2590779 RepID=A0A506XXG9_9MICO|nr:helix-turn-helix transcriptional regulator [Schumannella soli]
MSPAVFGHGHLRLYLLSLLAERSMHGYELIQALSERFGGTYVPSAGTIYPRLAKLEEEGLVTKQPDGRKTVYAITDAGRAELAEREHELDRVENELSDSVRRLADEVRSSVDGAMKSLRAELAAAARDARDESRASGRPERESTRAERDARAAAAGNAARESFARRGTGSAPGSGSSGSSAPGAGAPGSPADFTVGADGTASTGGSARSGSDPAAPGASGRSSWSAAEARTASRGLLLDAESALTDFRQRVRTDLRRAASRGELRPETLEVLRAGLSRLADELARTRR